MLFAESLCLMQNLTFSCKKMMWNNVSLTTNKTSPPPCHFWNAAGGHTQSPQGPQWPPGRPLDILSKTFLFGLSQNFSFKWFTPSPNTKRRKLSKPLEPEIRHDRGHQRSTSWTDQSLISLLSGSRKREPASCHVSHIFTQIILELALA